MIHETGQRGVDLRVQVVRDETHPSGTCQPLSARWQPPADERSEPPKFYDFRVLPKACATRKTRAVAVI